MASDRTPEVYRVGNIASVINSSIRSDNDTVGHVTGDLVGHDQGHNYFVLFLLVIPVFTVFGNVLVCLSVWKERSLQTATNFFIVSLALADIMVAILVMPLAVYVEVNNAVWELGDGLCDTWVAFDVMCCTASILNLTAISVDRFIAVTRPLKYAKHKNSKRVSITLVCTWVISIGVSLPIALGMNYTVRRSETPWLCTFYNADFLIYSSMASFYIPCLLMLLLYYKTFRAIIQRARRKKQVLKKPHATTSGPAEDSRDSTARRSVVKLGTPTMERGSHVDLMDAVDNKCVAHSNCLDVRHEEVMSTGGNLRLGSTEGNPTELDETTALSKHGQITEYGLCSTRQTSEEARSENENKNGKQNSKMAGNEGVCSHEMMTRSSIVCLNKGGTMTYLQLSPPAHLRAGSTDSTVDDVVGMVSSIAERREKVFTRREKKATKTLAIVLGVFLLCWMPFFTLNIINAVCIRYNLFTSVGLCNIQQMAFSLFVWLGYFNSFLNPVIYTIFNEEFRKSFKKLLLHPCHK